MSTREMTDTLHELESYGLIMIAADDNEIEEALTELAMAGEDGE